MQRSICFFRGSENGDDLSSHAVWDRDPGEAPGSHFIYNVPGLDAVELKLKYGKVSRIGTGDPSGLAAALNAGLRQ
jgi:hypothetical protein